jgi:hypothetical protein
MTTDPENETPVPDTAMATGNDEGRPGELLGESTLGPEEQAVLDDLRHGGGDDVVNQAQEDSPAMERAVENDVPLPGDP